MQLPEGRKALPIQSVYMIKCNWAGNVQRSKAGQVCGGIDKIENLNYEATYAPTARLGHLRLAITIASKYDLDIHQLDV